MSTQRGLKVPSLHFQGFVISDYMGIDKITPTMHGNYTYSILHSINAGIDMVSQ